MIVALGGLTATDRDIVAARGRLALSALVRSNAAESANVVQCATAAMGDFDRAIKQFQEALALHPGDKLSTTYIERCNYLKAHPPADWDGVWVMKSK